MVKFTLYCGLNDQVTNQQVFSMVEAYKIAMNICVRIVNGCTISEATGFYQYENGEIAIEKSLRIEIVNACESDVDKVISALKQAFNQESILKERTESAIAFC